MSDPASSREFLQTVHSLQLSQQSIEAEEIDSPDKKKKHHHHQPHHRSPKHRSPKAHSPKPHSPKPKEHHHHRHEQAPKKVVPIAEKPIVKVRSTSADAPSLDSGAGYRTKTPKSTTPITIATSPTVSAAVTQSTTGTSSVRGVSQKPTDPVTRPIKTPATPTPTTKKAACQLTKKAMATPGVIKGQDHPQIALMTVKNKATTGSGAIEPGGDPPLMPITDKDFDDIRDGHEPVMKNPKNVAGYEMMRPKGPSVELEYEKMEFSAKSKSVKRRTDAKLWASDDDGEAGAEIQPTTQLKKRLNKGKHEVETIQKRIQINYQRLVVITYTVLVFSFVIGFFFGMGIFARYMQSKTADEDDRVDPNEKEEFWF